MNKSIFRQKSVDKVTSPDMLNDYIHVTSPKVWIVIISILILLIGAITWGIFGTVEMKDGQGNVEEVHPITFIIN